MFRKAYILNFDLDSNFNSVKFHDELIKFDGLVAWWHYLKSSYILIVEFGLTADNITDYVMKIIPNKYFFVSELQLNDHNGWLPQEAWDWINKHK